MKRFLLLLALAIAAAIAIHPLASASDEPTSADAPSKPEKTAAKDAVKSDAPAAKHKDADSDKKDKEKESTATSKKEDSDSKADEKPAKEEKPAKSEEKRKTFKVEPKRLRIDLPLEGSFVAGKMTDVPFRPDSWSEYEIVSVVELGAKVHKGQVLFKFDSQKINEAIADMELEQRLNEVAIARSEEELPRMEKMLKMDFDDADRTDREAKEDFKHYNEIDRPMTVKSAQFMLKYYTANRDYEKDELDQLEKMYKADDLTEETEEIVLKRQRNSLEFAEFSLENAKINSDEMLNIRLPRMDIRMNETLDRAAMAKARAQMALSLDLDKARYELQQRKNARAKSIDKHTKLLADRELMEIKSPADGVVYYGECVNGHWADTASLITKYQPHNNVAGGSVVMTIVEPRPLSVAATFEEGKRPELSDGQKAKIIPPSDGEDRIAGKVKSISPLPVGSGKFNITFDIEQEEVPAWMAAGMSCKINVTTYDKAEAIVVPKKAVHDDENDADIHYVWLVDSKDADAKPERRDVKLGKQKGDDVEVIKGLKKGEVISLDDESEKKKDKEE